MLYVSTRNNRDAFTAQRALWENRAPDGGLYLPLRMPEFSAEDIRSLGEKSFGQNVADILNLLFNQKLAGWDVDFCIGRYPIRLPFLRHRILMAESWHNPDWNYDRLVNNLVSHLCDETAVPGDWIKIAVRIAVLFGIFGELKRMGIETADISVVSGDFSAPISAWYARQWGLPIRNIICCCNENGALWDFICRGQLRTDGVAVPTVVPEGDIAVPEGLERLIGLYGGPEEVERYVDILHRGGIYYAEDSLLHRLRQGIYVTVSSERRILATIPTVWSTHRYLLCAASALAYAGLQDYRGRTGEMRTALILTEKSPRLDQTLVAHTLGIEEQEVIRRL